MGTSNSGSRSSNSSTSRAPASNAIRRAILTTKAAVKTTATIPPTGGGK